MASNITSPHYTGSSSIEFKVEDGDGEDKKQMKIPARLLNIVWGNDDRYWTLPDADNIESPAVLNQVYWLEVTVCVEKTSGDKKYEVGFRVSLAPDAFGWAKAPLYVMAKRGKDGKFQWTKHFLMDPDEDDNYGHKDYRDITVIIMPTVDDQSSTSNDSKLYFGLYEVWSAKWKGGLRIHHAFIREIQNQAP